MEDFSQSFARKVLAKSKELSNLAKRSMPGRWKFDKYDSAFSPRLVTVSGYGRIEVGAGTRIYPHCVFAADSYSSRISVGKRCYLLPYVMLLTYEGTIEIGDDCSVNPFCVLYGHGGLRIGNGVRIAAHTVIIPANHTFSRLDIPIFSQPETREGIVIEDDVWIGAGVRILDGVEIGHGSVIGAGSVVTKGVEPYTVVGGVPAQVIRRRK